MSTEQALVQNNNVTAMHRENVESSGSIAPMVQMVASGQITIEQLDHLMGLQERHEAAEAKRKYNAAMANFRAEVPAALRDGKGQQSRYATLGSVMNAINGPLGSNGFNVDFRHSQDMDKSTLTVKCTITHSGGHSESTDLTVKVEKLGSANAVQSLGGNVSYLKRYCVSSLTGLATEDDDGQSTGPAKKEAPPVKMMTEADMQDMQALCTELGRNYDSFIKWASKTRPLLDGVLQCASSEKKYLIGEIRKAAKNATTADEATKEGKK